VTYTRVELMLSDRGYIKNNGFLVSVFSGHLGSDLLVNLVEDFASDCL